MSHTNTALHPLVLPGDYPIWDWGVGDPPLAEGLGGKKLVAVIGNLDGVHVGHQKLIAECVRRADEKNMLAAAISFTPHPRRFFVPEAEGFALTDDHDKHALLAEAGIKVMIRLRFNRAMQNTSAQDFISQVLPNLAVAELCAGEEFRFGTGREGTMAMLGDEGEKLGITAVPMALVEAEGSPISSSRIRTCLAEGDPKQASRFLGRPYCISGVVVKGEGRGRAMGFATANISLGAYQPPAFGVYMASVGSPELGVMPAIANIGIRPTVDGTETWAEAHIFNATPDLYGKRINIFCHEFLRPEKKFDNLASLRHQIGVDIKAARHWHRLALDK
ncbi:MAG: riboflavin biosynthesis protein RibF [Proteobacteria bacterium]|nr:riboflavin biosynthesis protein RibF [Pseudomonadota bacterium]